MPAGFTGNIQTQPKIEQINLLFLFITLNSYLLSKGVFTLLTSNNSLPTGSMEGSYMVRDHPFNTYSKSSTKNVSVVYTSTCVHQGVRNVCLTENSEAAAQRCSVKKVKRHHC